MRFPHGALLVLACTLVQVYAVDVVCVQVVIQYYCWNARQDENNYEMCAHVSLYAT